MSVETLVILNPSARRATAAAGLLARMAREPGVAVREARSRQHAISLARSAARRSVPLVVAAGGDGSVNAVATGLAGGATVSRLGVLPLGTANDLARTLGLPLDPRRAWQVLRSGSRGERTLDLFEARWGGRTRLVVNVLAGGNGAEVTRGADERLKRHWGAWSYLRSAARVLRDLERWRVAIELDDAPAVAVTLLTFVAANGPAAAGGLAVAPGADASDGLMDVVALQDAGVQEIAWSIYHLLAHHDMRGARVVHARCAALVLSSGTPFPLSIDGDAVGSTRRVRVRVLPAALRVAALTS